MDNGYQAVIAPARAPESKPLHGMRLNVSAMKIHFEDGAYPSTENNARNICLYICKISEDKISI